MNLSEREANIIQLIQHRTDVPISSLAKEVGMKEVTFRRSLKRLIDDEILVRRAYIDLYKLGIAKRALFLSFRGDKNNTKRNELLNFLQNNGKIAYIAEVGGDYQFKVDICTSNYTDLFLFLRSFSEQYGEFIRDKAIVQLAEQIEFSVRCFGGKPAPTIPLRMGIHETIGTIDELDHRILSELSEINEQSFGQLARRLGMPQSTFDYRVKNLFSRGILVGYRYIVNRSKLGLLDYFHLVYVRGMGTQTREQLYNFCAQHPNIRYFVQCIGSWDFEIGSNVSSPEEAIRLAEELRNVGEDAIVKITTLPLFRVSKVSNYPFKPI